MPDTYPIDEILKPYEGKRITIYVSGLNGNLDGFLGKDLGAGFSIFTQPAFSAQNPATGQPVDIPEAKVTINRLAIVAIMESTETTVSKLSPLLQ